MRAKREIERLRAEVARLERALKAGQTLSGERESNVAQRGTDAYAPPVLPRGSAAVAAQKLSTLEEANALAQSYFTKN